MHPRPTRVCTIDEGEGNHIQDCSKRKRRHAKLVKRANAERPGLERDKTFKSAGYETGRVKVGHDVVSPKPSKDLRLPSLSISGSTCLRPSLRTSCPASKKNYRHQLRVRPEREPWIRFIVGDEDTEEGVVPSNVRALIKDFHPRRYLLPFDIPVHQNIMVWDRWWMVKISSLGTQAGLGLFACEDVIVDCGPVELFPYAGPEYTADAWKALTRNFPKMKTYAMCCNALATADEAKRRFIDGTPENTGNISGYINSSYMTPAFTNCEWVECNGGHEKLDPRVDTYVMTVATKTLHAGDELFISYAIPPSRV